MPEWKCFNKYLMCTKALVPLIFFNSARSGRIAFREKPEWLKYHYTPSLRENGGAESTVLSMFPRNEFINVPVPSLLTNREIYLDPPLCVIYLLLISVRFSAIVIFVL